MKQPKYKMGDAIKDYYGNEMIIQGIRKSYDDFVYIDNLNPDCFKQLKEKDASSSSGAIGVPSDHMHNIFDRIEADLIHAHMKEKFKGEIEGVYFSFEEHIFVYKTRDHNGHLCLIKESDIIKKL